MLTHLPKGFEYGLVSRYALGVKKHYYTLWYGRYNRDLFGRPSMRHMIGERPCEIAKIGDRHTIKFYPMIKGAKNPDRVLFSLTVSKQELDDLVSKLR